MPNPIFALLMKRPPQINEIDPNIVSAFEPFLNSPVKLEKVIKFFTRILNTLQDGTLSDGERLRNAIYTWDLIVTGQYRKRHLADVAEHLRTLDRTLIIQTLRNRDRDRRKTGMEGSADYNILTTFRLWLAWMASSSNRP
jgi:hypothetical protein